MRTIDQKPRPGDRVKLIGSHRFAGYTAIYLADRPFPFDGVTRPWVKIEPTEKECYVPDPETQMRKI